MATIGKKQIITQTNVKFNSDKSCGGREEGDMLCLHVPIMGESDLKVRGPSTHSTQEGVLRPER